MQIRLGLQIDNSFIEGFKQNLSNSNLILTIQMHLCVDKLSLPL